MPTEFNHCQLILNLFMSKVFPLFIPYEKLPSLDDEVEFCGCVEEKNDEGREPEPQEDIHLN